MSVQTKLILEPAAQQLADATAAPPFLYELDYATARSLLDDILAGVPVTTVRDDGICHDFMMLNSLSQTNATRAAIAQAIAFCRQAFDGVSGGVAR